MMKQRIAATWICMLALVVAAGCAHAPTTFNERMLAIVSAADGAVKTANDLALTGTISKKAHRNFLDQASALKESAEITVDLRAKNPEQADRGLEYALTALRALQALLITYQGNMK